MQYSYYIIKEKEIPDMRYIQTLKIWRSKNGNFRFAKVRIDWEPDFCIAMETAHKYCYSSIRGDFICE